MSVSSGLRLPHVLIKTPTAFFSIALVNTGIISKKKNLPRFLIRNKQKVTRLPGFPTGL